jgi:hypothetical protein
VDCGVALVPGRVEVMSKKWTGSELAILSKLSAIDDEYLVEVLLLGFVE